MSALFLLVLATWVALIAVAFVAAVVQAIVHFLPPHPPAWEAPFAPTLAEERRA